MDISKSLQATIFKLGPDPDPDSQPWKFQRTVTTQYWLYFITQQDIQILVRQEHMYLLPSL